MSKDSSSAVLLLGGIGVAVYGYFQGWFASLGFSPAASPSTAVTAATGTTMPATIGTPAPVTTPPASNTPVVSGPVTLPPVAQTGNSLASILAALQASEAAAFGSDTALSGSASNPTASYDVHNWYLVNRTSAGVQDGQLSAPDHTSEITLTAYWAWAAPQIQALFPGLSGLGDVYAGLGALARTVRGGW